MKNSLIALIFVLGTVLIFMFALNLAVLSDDPITREIGPHNPYQWNSGFTASLSGVYSLKSDDYFEVKSITDPTDIHPSELQPPEEGEKLGEYTIKNIELNGEYSISKGADIFTLSDGTITLTPTTGEVVLGICFSIFIGICLWLLFIIVMSRLD